MQSCWQVIDKDGAYTALQTATCTVMVVHGGGGVVMEVVPWDSSMWWLHINIIFGHVTL